MKKAYHTLVSSLWKKHEETPLSANEAALYIFLLNLGYRSGWNMPIRLHNSEVCPMLMEKSALEKARKKLQEKGLITFTASRSLRKLPTYYISECVTEGCESVPANQKPRPCKTTAERIAAKNENTMIVALERMWSAFDERALNANEASLFSYLLHEAERNQWQMPFRCKDYMLLTLLLKTSALDGARRELASRNLITFDVGDGKRDVPQYTILGVGNNTPVKNGKSVAMCIETQGESSNKTYMATQTETNETSDEIQRTTSEYTSRDTPKDTPAGTHNVTSGENRNLTSAEVSKAAQKEDSHEVHRWPKVNESNVPANPKANASDISGNKLYGTEGKPQTKGKLNLDGNKWNKPNVSYKGGAQNHR